MALVSCPDCTAEISDQAPACVRCGRPMAVAATDVESPPAPGGTTNAVSAIASLVLPGLGQMAQGRRSVGAAFMFAAAAVWLLTLGRLGWLVHVVSAVEAAAHRPRPKAGAATVVQVPRKRDRARDRAMNRLLGHSAGIFLVGVGAAFVVTQQHRATTGVAEAVPPSAIAVASIAILAAVLYPIVRGLIEDPRSRVSSDVDEQ